MQGKLCIIEDGLDDFIVEVIKIGLVEGLSEYLDTNDYLGSVNKRVFFCQLVKSGDEPKTDLLFVFLETSEEDWYFRVSYEQYCHLKETMGQQLKAYCEESKFGFKTVDAKYVNELLERIDV